MKGNGSFETDSFIRNLQLLAFLTRHYIEERFVSEVSDKPISFVHMNLLRILEKHPGKTVGDIAKFMCVSYPAATKTIDKLVKLGFLRRREDSHDRRIAHLHLTQAGKRVVEKYSVMKRKAVEAVMNHFGMENAAKMNKQINLFARSVVDTLPIKSGVCMHCGAFDPEDCIATECDKKCGYLEKYPAP